MRVLIVEDNIDNRTIYAEILKFGGYQVSAATNGKEGVEKALELRPDLILMDLSMPVMDGWEAVRRLKEDPRTADIPVCALSAHVVLDGDHARSAAAGFVSYLTKPVEPRRVLREVSQRLGPARRVHTP